MITLAFLLDHQVISRSDKNTVVAGSKNYVRARFILRTDDWVRPITVIFSGYTQLLDDNNECTVPWEVLQQPGKVEVSAFCDDLHTANIAVVPVEKTGYKSGETPKDPTPDVYQQFLQAVKDDATAAKTAAKTAQAEAEKAATSAGQAASSAAEAAQSATNAAAEVGKVQSAGTSAVQAVQAAQNTATEAVSAAQQTATQTVSEAQATAVSAVQEAGTTQTSAVASAASSALTNISGAKDAALSDVAEAGAAQVSAIGTTGEDAVEDVNDAKTAALEAIDAANAALPSPTQSDAGKVPTVKADGSAYELAGPYAPLSAAIRPTASGNPVNITDSVEWPLLGLKVYGKSTQTTSQLLPLTETSYSANGLTATLQEDGSLIVNGTPGSSFTNLIYISLSLSPGDYYIAGGENTSGHVVAFIEIKKSTGTNYFANQSFSVDGTETSIIFMLQSNFANAINNYRVPAMLNKGTKPLPVQKYSGTPSPESPVPIVSAGDDGSIALTVSNGASLSQSMTISTPNGLPGIPVDSGGNYTDAEGQQWICDEIDYARGVHVQRVVLLEFDGSSDERIERTQTGVQVTPIFRLLIDATSFVPNDMNGLSNQFIAQTRLAADSELQNGTMWTKSNYFGNAIAVRADEFGSVQEFKEHLSTHPLKIMINAATPIETPIPPEELTAYRALHTYDDATVVSTPEDVTDIEVRYVANGEKYIDRKISEAIASAAETKLAAYDTLSGAIHEGVNEA